MENRTISSENISESYKKASDSVENSTLIILNNNKLQERPLISLIVPVYQEEKILERILKCFTPDLRNKFNIELIVSDGGSTDKTLEIAKKYADKIIVHTAERRQTISEGRNKGAEIAQGDILLFLNGDTYPAEPEKFFDFIGNWADGRNNYSECEALACKVYVSEDEILFKDKMFYLIHNFYVRFLNFLGIGMGRGECHIVRSDIFRKVGGYNSELVAGEDFDLYRRIAQFGKIAYVRQLCVYESPRRFRKYGYMRIIFTWTLNSLSVMLRGRSSSRNWEAVR